MSAPEASRMAVKLAASIAVSRRAMRQSSELLAKASIGEDDQETGQAQRWTHGAPNGRLQSVFAKLTFARSASVSLAAATAVPAIGFASLRASISPG